MAVDVQADLESLYAAIIARTTGKQVQSAGHKDKNTAFSSASLSEMLKLYRQLWTKESGLPDLAELEQSTVRRGPPARPYFGG